MPPAPPLAAPEQNEVNTDLSSTRNRYSDIRADTSNTCEQRNEKVSPN